ncbi:MAG: DUF805 domain-containing protein [Chloroflexi bacterium]|nr:DUF805 domain-containing protein [Chloroflexota bacterium]MDA1219713.1 DUF805 domain-containing protein [Chloroflexota bacterium]
MRNGSDFNGSDFNGSDFNGRGFLNTEHLKYLYLSPEGWINRQRIWLGGLLLAVAIIPINLLSLLFLTIGSFFIILAVLTYLAVLVISVIASIMLQIKRAHDRDHAGWYILLTMIPLIGIFFSIELHFFKGTDGPNQYGADPR